MSDDLRLWLGKPPRSRIQTHGVNESDSEVLRWSGGKYFATTVDSVSEEIAFGLYREPFTQGWVTAMATLSDLAAVGAQAQGFLFSAQWGAGVDLAHKRGVARGLRSALRELGVPLLGGDTGLCVSTVLTGVGLGSAKSKPISRLGIRPGDWILMSGKAGIGPAFGFQRVLGGGLLRERDYRPRARLDLASRILRHARAAMDTSDGLAVTLSTLAKLNSVEWDLEWRPKEWFNPKAARSCRSLGLPVSTLFFGEHGDFELVFAVSPEKLRTAMRVFPGAVVLGRARARSRAGTTLSMTGGKKTRLSLDLLDHYPKAKIEDFREAIYSVAKYLNAQGVP